MNDTATLTEVELDICVERSLKYVETDTAAVRQIAQAAVDVELFTIPLYMTAMYSIFGTHEINSKDIDYYKGRRWPGMAPSAEPSSEERKAFNLIFSVFIQEMLHLEMAANVSTAIGHVPTFTSSALQTKDHGWVCYGPDKSTIPYVIDLADTDRYRNTRVALGSLDENTLDLFCAIEQPTKDARAEIRPDQRHKYFPQVPFKDWSAGQKLPMFGSIGDMYECYAKYLRIRYEDGQTLWEKVFTADGVQQDLFNVMEKGHPAREFPGFETRLNAQDLADPKRAFDKAITMMSAITDQGEGSQISLGQSLLRYRFNPAPLSDVKDRYREDRSALKVDYPSYNGSGKPAPSADAEARADYSPETHFERFESLRGKLDKIATWAKWHTDPNHKWTASMLITADYDEASASAAIPKPQEVADALNRLKAKGASEHALLSKVAVGAIAGVTTVLDDYWKNAKTVFPYPSMAGSGDRVSLCWAVFGKTPDLALGIGAVKPDTLYHACQGMALEGSDHECAAIEVYHTCRGSNSCKAQGGCGFAQLDSGGGSCGHSSGCGLTAPIAEGDAPYRLRGRKSGASAEGNLCGGPTPSSGDYSAPSDNKCATFGGCAVPISASQMYPEGGTMLVYDFVGAEHRSEKIGEMTFALGDVVYDKAWEAYKKVMAHRGKSVGEPPKATDLRIALPPST